MKILGFKSIAEFARSVGISPDTARNHMRRGVCTLRASYQSHYLYSTWRCMISRCKNVGHVAYKYYGGKGIRVCEQWCHDFYTFVNDMGDKPAGTSLDRIDYTQNYTPENCKWSTFRDQSNNKADNTNEPCIIQSNRGYLGRLRICGKLLLTPTQIDIEQVRIDLEQLKLLYPDYI